MPGIFIIAVIVAAVLIIRKVINDREIRNAGKRGEKAAADIISSVLCDGDHLLNNVQITFDGRPAEMDNVVINRYGVFIIEVKNYKGRLYGSAEDYEWKKFKTTDAGNTYEKTVKNPIRQVRRQIHILAKYLESHGFRVWVEGRAVLLQAESPVSSPFILTSVDALNRTIHTFGRNRLDEETVKAICELLSSGVQKHVLMERKL